MSPLWSLALSYLSALRQHLARRRSEGVPFPEAWAEALHVTDAGDFYADSYAPEQLRKFLREHFAAAYQGRSDGAGRLRIEPPEVHATVAMPAGEGLTARRRCGWGAGCERLAVAGRLGPMFCKRHARELERVRRAYDASRFTYWERYGDEAAA